MSEPSIKKENKSLQSINEYDEEVNDIIYNILDEIFKTLDIVNINNNENQTYIGYFQKIINYSLIKESKIIINYLFKDNPPKIKKLYKFLNNFSIKNILENLLNIISDLEEDEENNESKNSKFLKIINDLFNELNNDHNFIKSEFICELIINTLITNNEKQLIQFIFKESGMEIIKNNIKNIINKYNNDKLLIGIIDIIYYLNNTIMNSLTDGSFLIFKENRIFFNNDYRNINTFEYHYNCLKNISKKNIIDAFKQHSEKYLNILVDIYFIIKEKIKENKNILKNKFTNIIPISIRYKKKFGLKNLYEWKLILSCLKIYIFYFHLKENSEINFGDEKNNIFLDEEFFHILINFYFIYRYNNLYQNIFIEIIQLICNEKCPKNLTNRFLSNIKIYKYQYIDGHMEEKIENKFFIDLIIENLEIENKYRRQNLLVGSDIKILQIFFFSNNEEIMKFIQYNDIYQQYKDLFIYNINSKFERKLDEDYSFSISEIFLYDNDDTFDGNNNKSKMKYKSIENVIDNFIEKCKIEKKKEKIYLKKSKKIKINKGNIIKQISTENKKFNIKEKKLISEYEEIEINEKEESINNCENIEKEKDEEKNSIDDNKEEKNKEDLEINNELIDNGKFNNDYNEKENIAETEVKYENKTNIVENIKKQNDIQFNNEQNIIAYKEKEKEKINEYKEEEITKNNEKNNTNINHENKDEIINNKEIIFENEDIEKYNFSLNMNIEYYIED